MFEEITSDPEFQEFLKRKHEQETASYKQTRRK
jgi:hypothetical protein